MSKGYIQAAFQARHGITVAEWLRLHGSQYTLRQAAEFIGYECTSSLSGFRTWLDKHAPGVQFKQPDRRKTSPLRAVSDAQFKRAMQLRSQRQGRRMMTWQDVAGVLGVNAETLRQGVTKYGHRVSKARSPVIAAFEARTGQDTKAWLQERQGKITLKAAAIEIGYCEPAHLTAWMRRNMPGFQFAPSRSIGLTDDDLRAALRMKDEGATWNAIAQAYSCNRQTLWSACKQYQKRTKPA